MPGLKTGYIKTTRADKTNTIAGALTVSGALTINGNMTFGDASVDTLSITGLTTVATNQKIQFRDTGLFINSGADGKLTISSDGSGTDDITLSGTVTLNDDLITPTTKKVQFRDSGLYINSSADGKLVISADGTGSDDITLSGTVTIADVVTMQAGLDYTGITPSGTTPIVKCGTSSVPISTSTANTNFSQYYNKTTATSGDARGIYNRLYIANAGTGGESLRTFTTVDNVASGTAHGAHISLNFNTSGTLSGLGVAGRNTLHVPNAAGGCGTGTFAPVQAEIYGDGASSTIAPASEFSFVRMIVDGATVDVKATVDTSGNLFSIQGLTAGATKLFRTGLTAATVNANTTAALKILVGSTAYFIPLATATT